jgi:hypothetical protein
MEKAQWSLVKEAIIPINGILNKQRIPATHVMHIIASA